MAYLALDAVWDAVYAKLNVAGLTALVSTRIYDDVPQNPTFPFVFCEVVDGRSLRGFGTGGFPEVELRVHAYSSSDDYNGMGQVHEITQKVIELLRDQSLSISGYSQAGLVEQPQERPTVLLPNAVISGVKCRELVAFFIIRAEESV